MADNSERRTDPVSRAYAQALFELAEEQGVLEEVADEMDQLAELLRSEPGLRRLVESPALSDKDRAASLERLFKDRVSSTLYRFLMVLNQKGRLNALHGVIQAFSNLVAERRGVVEVDLFVPQRFDAQQINELADRLGQILNRQVVLYQYVDESLIGGLKLRVGDRLIDGSVATQLQRLRRTLARTGRQRARHGGEIQE